MNIDKSFQLLSKYYSCDINKLKYILDLVFKENLKDKEIILPFDGKIKPEKCKAVVYNHGLFTQCTNDCVNICKTCSSLMINGKLKYGHINERIKYPIGNYVYNNKKETNYEIFINKMGYKKNDVINALRSADIDYSFDDKTKRRGRPKKDIFNDEIEIEVTKINKNGVTYLLTYDNILLTEKGDLVGILQDETIIKVNL